MKSIEEYFTKEQEEFKGPVTRKRFRGELIRLVFNMISTTVFEDFYDRERYVGLLDLLLEGKSYEDFVLSTQESYFIDSNAFQNILCFSKIAFSARNGHIIGKFKQDSAKKRLFL